MARLAPMLLFIHIALLVVALLDCLSAQESTTRTLSRNVWIFVILLLAPLGAIAWFVVGQPAPAIRSANGTVLRPGRQSRRDRDRGPIGPIGPDDDPEFIQSLAAALRANGTDPGR